MLPARPGPAGRAREARAAEHPRAQSPHPRAGRSSRGMRASPATWRAPPRQWSQRHRAHRPASRTPPRPARAWSISPRRDSSTRTSRRKARVSSTVISGTPGERHVARLHQLLGHDPVEGRGDRRPTTRPRTRRAARPGPPRRRPRPGQCRPCAPSACDSAARRPLTAWSSSCGVAEFFARSSAIRLCVAMASARPASTPSRAGRRRPDGLLGGDRGRLAPAPGWPGGRARRGGSSTWPARTRSPGRTVTSRTSATIRLTRVAVVRARTAPPVSNGRATSRIEAAWTATSTGVRRSSASSSWGPPHAVTAMAAPSRSTGVLLMALMVVFASRVSSGSCRSPDRGRPWPPSRPRWTRSAASRRRAGRWPPAARRSRSRAPRRTGRG